MSQSGIQEQLETKGDARLRVEVVDSDSGFAGLRERWNGLLARSLENNPLLTFEWFDAWWRVFGGRARPYVITVWKGDQLVGIAPMAYKRWHFAGIRYRIMRLWANRYSDRSHLIVSDPAGPVVKSIVHHLLHDSPPWDMLRFDRLPRDGDLTSILRSELRRQRVRHGEELDLRSPFLRIPATWFDLESRLSPGFRGSLRRKIRKARASIATKMWVTDSPDAVEDAFSIAEKTWQYRYGTSIASAPEFRQFYRDLARGMAERGWLQLAFLSVDGEPACFEYNLVYDGIVYNLKLGYREDRAEYSPGVLLKSELLQAVTRDGVREYDFMGDEEDYKLQWATGVREHTRVWVYADGSFARSMHVLRHRVKPWIRQHAPWGVKFYWRTLNHLQRLWRRSR